MYRRKAPSMGYPVQHLYLEFPIPQGPASRNRTREITGSEFGGGEVQHQHQGPYPSLREVVAALSRHPREIARGRESRIGFAW